MSSIELKKAASFSENYIWLKKHVPGAVARLKKLVDDILQHPCSGIGQPEPLRHGLGRLGYWSRRITQEHRLIYRIVGDTVTLLFCRGHYDDR